MDIMANPSKAAVKAPQLFLNFSDQTATHNYNKWVYLESQLQIEIERSKDLEKNFQAQKNQLESENIEQRRQHNIELNELRDLVQEWKAKSGSAQMFEDQLHAERIEHEKAMKAHEEEVTRFAQQVQDYKEQLASRDEENELLSTKLQKALKT